MPRYQVTTDQGKFEVNLDSEPSSAEELNQLVTEYLSQAAPQLQQPGDRWTPTSDIARDPYNPGRQPMPPGLLTRMKNAFTERLSQGATDISEAFSPTRSLSDVVKDTPPPSMGQRVLRGLGGAANIISAPAAPAGVVGGELMAGLVQQSGELTDEVLDRKIAEQEMRPTVVDGPGSAAALKALRTLPYEQRVKQAREGGEMQTEFGVGFFPGYTLTGRGIAAGARALRRPVKAAGDAAEVVEAVPKVVGQAEDGRYIVQGAGGERALMTDAEARTMQGLELPANVSKATPMDSVDDVTEQVTGSARVEPGVRQAPMDVPDEVAERVLGTTTTGQHVPRRGPKINREQLVADTHQALKQDKDAALIEIEEAKRAAKSPDEARVDDAISTIDPAERPIAQWWKEKLQPFLWRTVVSPDTVTRRHPDAFAIHLKAKEAEDFRDGLIIHWRDLFEKALRQAQNPRQALPQIVKLLDTPNPNLSQVSPDVAAAYQSARQALDELAQSTKLQPGLRLSRYTRLDGKYNVEPLRQLIRGAARKVAFDGGFDPRTNEVVTGLMADIQPNLWDEGLDAAGKPVKSPRLPHDLAGYIGNDYLPVVTGKVSPQGHIKGFGGQYEASQGLWPLVNNINRYQFARTIGGNLMSPMVNATQQLLTFAHTDPMSFIRGYKDLFSPRMRQLAADAGIKGSLSKGDVDRLARLVGTKVERVEEVMSSMFQGSEQLNRLHAFFVGMRMAQKQGMGQEAAKAFAKEFVDTTQFRLTRAGMPPAWHGGPLRRLPLMYKGFQFHYAKRMKDMVKQDVQAWGQDVVDFSRAARAGDVTGAAGALKNLVMDIGAGKLAKFWGGGALMFGPDVMTLGYIGNTPRAFEALQWKNNEDDPLAVAIAKNGLLPYFGIWLGHQVGLGAMPIENAKSLLFSLTGPSLAQVMDAFSVGMSVVTGMQYDFRPDAWVGSPDRAFGTQPIDWHKNIGKIIHMLPAGVQLEKARRSVMIARSEDPEIKRRPVTEARPYTSGIGRALRHSVGMEPLSKTSPMDRPYTKHGWGPPQYNEAARQFIGAQDPETQRTYDRRRLARMTEDEINNWATHAAEVLASTKDWNAAINSIPEDIRQQVGPSLPGRIRGAYQRAYIKPELRQMLRAPRHLRPRINTILEGDDE